MDNPGTQNNRIAPCPERNLLFCICGNVLVFPYRCSSSRHTAFCDSNVYSKPDNSFRRGQTWPYQSFPLAFSLSSLPVLTFYVSILPQFQKRGNSQFPSRGSTAIKTTSKLAVFSAPREASTCWPLKRILKNIITSLALQLANRSYLLVSESSSFLSFFAYLPKNLFLKCNKWFFPPTGVFHHLICQVFLFTPDRTGGGFSC